MYISTRENGTEAPMYTSVGTNENGGNLITLNWENEDAGAGVKLAWPVLHVQTTAEIGEIDLVFYAEITCLGLKRSNIKFLSLEILVNI